MPDGESEIKEVPRWLLVAMAAIPATAFLGIVGLAIFVHWLKG